MVRVPQNPEAERLESHIKISGWFSYPDISYYSYVMVSIRWAEKFSLSGLPIVPLD